ncbi:hypothetical protein AVEN_203947-1 [Araneus ventricosus]|uniref:Uncharacterized protein n=1 Tax=Araneus ventricosus TaxID=182803 RepID=A0A4Y1ZMC2_ARAVE|nr:hypothetical protein AVEN_270030-1 [Araneus ventricosus]GBL58247.1 hypothetical protein AVEN_65547-1 [Araneus ventricosus]GBL58414.1 hypothetical protein AVEN_140251-1 [Araneus ventricosus]GBL58526.1 hypothetical protein AVEN_203947-1 [Araneus ventricosus]
MKITPPGACAKARKVSESVAIQYGYKHGKSLPSTVSRMVGKKVYRDKYGMTGSSHVCSTDLGDHLDDKIGDYDDEIWDLKAAGIFSISVLGEEIRLNVLDDSM